MGTSSKTPAIYFKSLELENIRCFGERQILDLTDGHEAPAQWTLLLGDNGLGKTTLLQCLAWMRPVPTWKKPPGTPADAGPPDDIEPAIYSEENEVFSSLLRSSPRINFRIEERLAIGHGLGRITRSGVEVVTSISGTGAYRKLKSSKQVSVYPEARWKPEFLEPPIFAYNATRYMGSANLEKNELSDPLVSLFTGQTELYDAEKILYRLDYSALKRKEATHQRRREQVIQLLTTILPDITREKDIKILGPKVPGNVESGVRFKTPYGWVPFSGLSLGYQTTLAWVIDLAWRLFIHYPRHKNPLQEPAIVLIDEIDLHLHPRWQRQIMGDLTKHYGRLLQWILMP